ncbi:MAG: NusG domain II-containing protein [Lawsonibacter sp.]|nr:NusG domain II-containing protein [Lawsonibacter sp.]
MNKNTRIFLLLLALTAAAATGFLFLAPKKISHPVARITLDGEVVKEIDLDQVEVPYSFTLTGASGLTNTILVEHGCIRVSEASCPDQICVHQGTISDGTVPIVCLPNHLIIEIIGGGEALDAATG